MTCDNQKLPHGILIEFWKHIYIYIYIYTHTHTKVGRKVKLTYLGKQVDRQ